ncbi:MAG: hypothetical protein J5851_08780 [Oscillospiraceae bacterium]|nr:hypothetical protein [Oscillospiraceae bacterium]
MFRSMNRICKYLLCLTVLAAALCATGCDEAPVSAEQPDPTEAVTQAETVTEPAQEETTPPTEAEEPETAPPTEAQEETAPPEPVEADYVITKVSGEPDWDSIPAVPIDQVLWTDDFGIRGAAQLCYDSEHLYVHLSAVESDIRAENTEPLAPVYQDSCLEFFFQPEGADKYFNIEMNPNGCVCMEYGPAKTDRFALVRGNIVEYFNIRTDRTADGWEAFYDIPLDYFRYFFPDYEFTGVLYGNFYKCGNLCTNKHFLAWKPIDLASPDFHRPEFFGTLVYGE